jgi:hypothetical protein
MKKSLGAIRAKKKCQTISDLALFFLVGRTTKSWLVGNHHQRKIGGTHQRQPLGQSLVLTQASFQSPTSYQTSRQHHGTQVVHAFVATTKLHPKVVSWLGSYLLKLLVLERPTS